MATVKSLPIDQGSDFSETLNLTDALGNAINLATYTYRGQIRKNYTSTSVTNFTIATTSNVGELTLTLTNQQTSALKPGRYVYDVQIIDSTGIVTRVLEGIVTVNPVVTVSTTTTTTTILP